MKKLIVILITLITIPAIAYGTARFLSAVMPVQVPGSPVGTVTQKISSVSTKVDPAALAAQKAAADEHATTDNQIKVSMQRIASSLVNYAANNAGAFPAATVAATQQFSQQYLKDIVHPVTKKPYVLSPATNTNPENIVYKPGYGCPDTGTKQAISSRLFSLQIVLGSTKTYCVDNTK